MIKRHYDKSELVQFSEKFKGQNISLEDKDILLHFDSFCLGDTICFSAFIESFIKFHKTKKVYITTFFSHLFIKEGDGYEFIAATQNDKFLKVDKLINVGYRKESLEHTIEGMMYAVKDTMFIPQDTKPGKCPVIPKERKVQNSKITIAPESLKKIAVWDYNGVEGWQTVVDELKNRNYEVFNISYEDTIKLKNVYDFHNFDDINISLNHILESKIFIGLSSGLAWLAWAYEVPVVMISNFTKTFNEFECFRVVNEKGC